MKYVKKINLYCQKLNKEPTVKSQISNKK